MIGTRLAGGLFPSAHEWHDVQHPSGANVVRHACLLDPCPRCRLSRAEDDALRHRHFLTAVESDPAFA
ncbi:MAG TPA: hypothetical protein VKJ47_15840 [Candidatus Binatia bacterium]|nr:hypothetical protein [Candidatus Binatia bacterium]